jgi:hypothetical protein
MRSQPFRQLRLQRLQHRRPRLPFQRRLPHLQPLSLRLCRSQLLLHRRFLPFLLLPPPRPLLAKLLKR